MLLRLVVYCAIAALLGIGSSIYFTFYLNPDYNFFAKCFEASEKWEHQLRKKHPQVYVIAGGSSARTGIDPQVLLDEYQIPFVNGAMGAGYGLDANSALAWKHVRAHDTFILAMEMGLIAQRKINTSSAYGLRMLFREQGLELHHAPFIQWDWKLMLAPFRTSSSELASYITKRLTRPKSEMYSYDQHARIHASGWMEVTENKSFDPAAVVANHVLTLSSYNLAAEALDFYERVKQECSKHQVKLIVVIPRCYAHESAKAAHLWIALQITRLGINVLYDAEFSTISSPAYFSDTALHLNAKGALLNTRQLGESLSKQHFWTESDLVEQLRKLGWDKDGKRIQKEL